MDYSNSVLYLDYTTLVFFISFVEAPVIDALQETFFGKEREEHSTEASDEAVGMIKGIRKKVV